MNTISEHCCPQCGHYNPSTTCMCQNCKASLPDLDLFGAKSLSHKSLEVRYTVLLHESTFKSKLIEAMEKHQDLLQEELNELAGYAVVHGWESHRVEAGIDAKEKIDKIKAKLL